LGQAYAQFKATGPHDLQMAWMRQWPDVPLIRYLTFANTEIILVNSVQVIREVLGNKCYTFEKPQFFRRIGQEVAGVGLLFAEGEEHKRARKILNGKYLCSPNSRLVILFVSIATWSLHGRSVRGVGWNRVQTLMCWQPLGSFSITNLKKLIPIFNDKTLELVSRIRKQNIANNNAPIEGLQQSTLPLAPTSTT
jgi:hypothetical protein